MASQCAYAAGYAHPTASKLVSRPAAEHACSLITLAQPFDVAFVARALSPVHAEPRSCSALPARNLQSSTQ